MPPRDLAIGVALIGLCAWLLVFLSMPAFGQADDATTCAARKGAPAVAACTRLIEGGKAKGVTLYLHHNDRGGAYQTGGTDADHRRALDDFTAAIGIDGKLPYAFINRGVSWAALGAYERAIDDFAQALRVDPRNARAFNNRGGAHRDRGEFDRAMADFNKALALDPKLADALFNRGTLYMQKEDFARAIADYSAVLKQAPKDVLALAARGRAWSSRDDDRRARADFEAALAAPAEDEQSRTVQEAVRELLRALLEKRAAIEQENQLRKQADAEKKAADERQAALEKQAAAEKRAADERQAALEKKAAAEKRAADERQAALEKKAAAEKRAADERQAALDKKAAADKRAADEQQAALDKKAAAEKRAAEERLAALEKKVAAEKRAAEERQAALEKKVAAEKKAAEERQAALEMKAAAEKKAAEERLAALESKAAAEKKAAEEKLAALPKQAPPTAPVLRTDAPRRSDRMALVIGNSAYVPALGRLENPAHDAADVAKALKQLGFVVWLGVDLGHVDMKATIEHFSEAAHGAETAVVFFAGHGFQYGATNYLAPVDSPIDDENSIANHVSLDAMMASLKADRGVRILIIDACRNNLAVEEAASRQATASRSVLVKRGLSPVSISSTWAGGGMLIAFATLPGDVASDGAGRNSPFTHALVKHMRTPNLELRHLFVRVRAEVVTATLGRQIPQVSDALNGVYVFNTARQK